MPPSPTNGRIILMVSMRCDRVALTFSWMFTASSVLLSLSLVAAQGHQSPIAKKAARPAAKITLRADGYAPDEIERLIARPVVEAWAGVEGISAVTAVSEAGRAEIYLEPRPEMTEQQLSRTVLKKMPSLDTGDLPAGVTISAYELLPDFNGPPSPEQNDRPCARVEVKREAAALYGIETRAILEAIEKHSPPLSEPATQNTVDAIRRLTVASPNGQQVPLSEIVDIRLEKMPSSRTYRWPQDAKPK